MTSLDARFQLFHAIGHSECSLIISYGTCWALLHGLKLSARGKKTWSSTTPQR